MAGSFPRIALLGCCLGLVGCGSEAPPPPYPGASEDPALAGALADQIMVDPDLANRNQANSAIRLPDAYAGLPSADNSPAHVAAAREDAARLVGGSSRMLDVGAAAGGTAGAAETTRAAQSAMQGDGGADCAALVARGAGWAARMPAAFPIYPRGTVTDAGGTDAAGCSLRLVTFSTPVALEEVLAFYYTRARAAGFSAGRERGGADGGGDGETLGGVRGAAAYIVYARQTDEGRTEIDLVTGGV